MARDHHQHQVRNIVAVQVVPLEKKAKANSGDAPKRSSFPFFNKLKAQPKCHYNKTTNGRNENGPNSGISAVFETCTKCT